MSTNKTWKQDELLVDLKESIKKALDNKLVDLAGALLQLQGSAHGWCDDESCGACPLHPRRCSDRLQERVVDIIDEHHSTAHPTSRQI